MLTVGSSSFSFLLSLSLYFLIVRVLFGLSGFYTCVSTLQPMRTSWSLPMDRWLRTKSRDIRQDTKLDTHTHTESAHNIIPANTARKLRPHTVPFRPPPLHATSKKRNKKKGRNRKKKKNGEKKIHAGTCKRSRGGTKRMASSCIGRLPVLCKLAQRSMFHAVNTHTGRNCIVWIYHGGYTTPIHPNPIKKKTAESFRPQRIGRHQSHERRKVGHNRTDYG